MKMMHSPQKLRSSEASALTAWLFVLILTFLGVAVPLQAESSAVAPGAVRSSLSLDGTWQFMPALGSSNTKPTGKWGEIKVPGNWNRDKDGAITKRGSGSAWADFDGAQLAQAWYERSVSIPVEWKGRGILLDVDRVSTDALIFVNGTEAGKINWPGGKLDITKLVTPGQETKLRLKVFAVDDLKEVEIRMGYTTNEKTAAKLDLRGIIGSVTLTTQPTGPRLSDVFARPSTRTKKLHLDLEFADTTTPIDATLVVEARDENGQVEKTFTAPVKTAANGVTTVTLDWPDARWWDVGQPNLYSLHLSLVGPGLKDEFLLPRFGFREFWIEGKKLFLNNSEIRLRPTDFEGDAAKALEFGYNYGEAVAAAAGGGNFARRGTNYHLEPWVESADRAGFLLGTSAGQWNDVIGNWNDPAKRADWERITEREIRRVRNFPSVVSWTHSFNGFQWPGDGDPRFLGKKDFVAIQEYEMQNKRINEALAWFKSLNGDAPTYAHFGTYNGDIYTSNLYLDYLPLQEREEWLSHWAKEGTMPFMACEFGLPLYTNSMRGRSGYSHQGVSEPLNTEWMASFLGKESYSLEQPDYLQLIRDRYQGTDLQKEYEPHIRWDKKDELISGSPSFDLMLTDFISKTFRSWRTMGLTAGVVPWHSKWHPELRRSNGPTLAWIAGKGGLPSETTSGEAFTSKDHSYPAGGKIEKQAVLINDTRTAQDYSFKWEIEVAGKIIGQGEKSGQLAVSETLMSPFACDVPTEIASAKVDGAIRLTATIGGQVQTDTFAFRVFAPEPPRKGEIAVFDPEGRTAAMLESLGYTVLPWTEGKPATPLAVVGRKALSSGHTIPAGWREFVSEGGRVLIEAQDPYWIKYALDLRTAAYVSRQVFPINANHPVVAGLDSTDLRDWRGQGTLVESHPSYEGFNWAPRYGWRWGNRGSVTSAPIEKPHRSSWRPILENEWDLAYSPLMEMESGKGRVLLCTLDLEDGVSADPAARKLAAQVVDYALTAPITPKAETVLYLGGKSGADLLDFLGVVYQPATEPTASAELVIVGPDAATEPAALESYAAAGGRVLFLPRADALGWGDVKTVRRPDFKGSLDVPAWKEAAGLSASDLRWRNQTDAWVLEAPAPVEIGADGQLARRTVGKGLFLYTQLSPDAVPADTKSYFRTTRWRQTRALSQVLANVGATFKNDATMLGLLAEPKPTWMLAGLWDVKLTRSLPESPVRKWNSNPGITKEALRLTQPDASLEGMEKHPVPAYMESYGPTWRYVDGEIVYRKEFDVPAYAAGKPLFAALGRVDDEETTFFNGTKIASSDHWVLPRGHVIPGEHVVAGKNVLTVVAFDRGIHGGWNGDPNQISLRAAGDPAPFYHPDYRDDDLDQKATTQEDWQARQDLWSISDNPYRYYRW